MADTKISGLTAKASSAVDGAEIIPYAEAGGNGSMLSRQIFGQAVPNCLTGRYYWFEPAFIGQNGDGLVGAVRGYYTPIVPVRDVTVANLVVNLVTTGTATTCALAIYDSQVSGGKYYPTGTALGQGAATFSAGTTGIKDVALAANVTLNAGHLYWIALASDGSANFTKNQINFAIGFCGEATPSLLPNTCAWLDNGITVGTWRDLTTSPGSGNFASVETYFAAGLKSA